MSKERSKPGREKRKPKKGKSSGTQPARGNDTTLGHISQHPSSNGSQN